MVLGLPEVSKDSKFSLDYDGVLKEIVARHIIPVLVDFSSK